MSPGMMPRPSVRGLVCSCLPRPNGKRLRVGWMAGSIHGGMKTRQASRCNYDRAIDDTMPVGTHAVGDSPYGVADMAGNVLGINVLRWGTQVATPEYKYPYSAADGREDLNVDRKVLRVCVAAPSTWVHPVCAAHSVRAAHLGAAGSYLAFVWFGRKVRRRNLGKQLRRI